MPNNKANDRSSSSWTEIALHDINNISQIISLKVAALCLDRGLSGASAARLQDIAYLCGMISDITRLQFLPASLTDDKDSYFSIDQFIRRHEATLSFCAGLDTKLYLNLSCPTVQVRASETQLLNAIMNVMLNARKSLRERKEISIATELLNQGESARTSLVVRITDPGHGMNPAEIEKCKTFRYSSRGAKGIGLTSVMGFLLELDSELAIQSSPGEGTQVSFIFDHDVIKLTEHSPDDQCRSSDSCRVGIIGSDPARIAAIRHSISTNDVIVYEFDCPDAFFVQADKLKINIVVIDYDSARAEDRQFAEKVFSALPNTPLILVGSNIPEADKLIRRWPFVKFPEGLYRIGKLIAALRLIERSYSS